MLQPHDRRLLMESLRPPPGLQLDFAIGTTFSLDLVALLVTPMAFTFFDWEADDGKPITEPIALLQSIRRNAERMAIFCQAGEIKIPPRDQRLFAYLEDCVHQVTAHEPGGVFHPKVWILRYLGQQDEVIYRLICASRNMTFDRSWDTLLVLDGHLLKRQNGIGINNPLGDFVRALPKLSIDPLPTPTLTRINQIEYEVRRVAFEAPEGMELTAFWPLGIPDHRRWPFQDCRDRRLVISPFVSEDALRRLRPTEKQGILISRADSLRTLSPELLAGYEEVLVLDPSVDDAVGDSETTMSPALRDSETSLAGRGMGDELKGLHAKLFVVDDGWDARVWTGSANATSAAFHQNVEFLVELKAKKSQIGIDALIGSDVSPTDLRKLLQPYGPIEPTQDDIWQERFDREALKVRLAIVQTGIRGKVTATAEKDIYELVLTADRQVEHEGVILSCWPITCSRELFEQQGHFDKDVPLATFQQISIEAITPFIAFSVRIEVDGKIGESCFVLKARLAGAPDDRKDHLLQYVIRNQRELMAYLLMLLAGPDDGAISATFLQHFASGGPATRHSWLDVPLFESLVRCLDRNPKQLEEVGALLNDLGTTESGRALIPDGVQSIWTPIWSAYLSMHVEDE